MLLNAANLPCLQHRELHSSIHNNVYALEEITSPGLFKFLSYLAGLSSKEGISILEVMAEGNLWSLIRAFVSEDIHSTKWVPIDLRTVYKVFTQHILPRTLWETEIAIYNLSKWLGMECYFINLWVQSIDSSVDQTGHSWIRRSGPYRKWRAWCLSYAWPFA